MDWDYRCFSERSQSLSRSGRDQQDLDLDYIFICDGRSEVRQVGSYLGFAPGFSWLC